MAEYKVDISKLPEDVREKLAELDLELSEGKHFFSEKSCHSSVIQLPLEYPYSSSTNSN